MWFEKENTVYVSMPGVPFEMKQMMTNSILPMLKERFSLATVIHKTILTTGLGESFLAARIEQWEDDLPAGVKLAYLPQPGIVRLRLTGKSCHAEKLKNDIAEHTIKLKQLIPDLIFGEDQDTMEKVIGDKLKLRRETISTAESCTGGYIAHLITSLPGSSQWYNGSIVSYSNEAKHNLLEVPTDVLEKFGAVSQEVVESMALRVKEKFNTTWSIAVSGIAGPDGGTAEKPVGTVWVAIAGPNYLQSEYFLFGDNRERNIRRSAIAALNLLRIKLD
jgi:nicotinamide-nucleotide amidase